MIPPLILFIIQLKSFINRFKYLLQIVVPSLPGKAWKRQMPFRGDDGIFEEDFIEDRRKGLEVFVNKYVLSTVIQIFRYEITAMVALQKLD
jgi:hypothetical protein